MSESSKRHSKFLSLIFILKYFFFLPRNCSVYVTEKTFHLSSFLVRNFWSTKKLSKIKCLPEEHVLNSRELGETCPL